jgi:predicted ATPase/signal transduction histidine kinase/tRNA A-37 threonylcarbamoyl transferase component Bud32
MEQIAGYSIAQQWISTGKYAIYRATDSKGENVLLKMALPDLNGSRKAAALINEYNLLREFSSPLVVKCKELIYKDNSPVLVLDDIGGVSLQEFIRANPSGCIYENFGKALEISILLAKAIDLIHSRNIIHKDINPGNIVYNSIINELNILDFNLATKLSFEKYEISNINLLEGSLPYISPEQTGRINRNIDYRSDFYSLGVTLYELFSGKLPFTATTPREWVHCHIAKSPVPLNELNMDIPRPVAAIVAKLLSKTAELRYQGSYGIIEDLQACLTMYQTTGRVDFIETGQKDISQKFRVSQKIYGRENEINLMLETFTNLEKFNCSTVMVKGWPGIGKSALVGEIYKLVTEKNGFFISGKFEQFRRDIPYFAIIEAFTRLFQSIITEPEETVSAWKENLLFALAGNGQVVIDLIPSLELLIGTQPPVAELPAFEAQRRFVLTFQHLVEVIADVLHPLVVYLDDLQWADHASLNLLKALISNSKIGAFLCIGAYRDNEIHEGHPLATLLESIRKEQLKLVEIELQPLSARNISELIRDSFSCATAEADELASVCFSKTQGNPFFISEFLNNLHRKGEIAYDAKNGKWVWNIANILKTKVTDNVVDLVCSRIKELDEDRQRTLQIASCIGSRFDMDMLSQVSGKGKAELAAELSDSMNESFVAPLSNDYRLAGYDDLVQTKYRFLHDRILQAAYSLINESDKQTIHLKIARIIRQNNNLEENSPVIFTLANHFNKAIELLSDEEKIYVAELNLLAGRKAKASSAFLQALHYFEAGLALLPVNHWKNLYSLSLKFYSVLAETAFLCNERAKMKEMLKEVENNAKSVLDKIPAWETQLLCLCFDHEFQQAIRVGLGYLKELNYSFPQKTGKLYVFANLRKTKSILRKTSNEAILALPKATDKNTLAAFRIMGMLITPSYYAYPNLFPLLAFKFVQMTLAHGLSPLSPLGFITFGMINNVVFNKIDESYQYGRLGMDILDKLDDLKYRANTSCIYNASLRFWKEPLSNSIEGFYKDYDTSLETGNIEYATTSTAVNLSYQIFAGARLNDLFTRFSKYQQYLLQWPKQPSMTLFNVFLQTIINLQNGGPLPEVLIGEKCDENLIRDENEIIKDNAQMASMYVYKLILAYVFERKEAALKICKELNHYIENIKGLLNYPVFLFFESLVIIDNYEELSALRKVKAKLKVRKNLKMLKMWAAHAPYNFRGSYLLVDACFSGLSQDVRLTSEKFTLALNELKKSQNFYLLALCYEQFHLFWLKFGNREVAANYLALAYSTYENWGATAKLQQLEEKHSSLINVGLIVNQVFNSPVISSSGFSTSTQSIDTETLMDVSKAISGEIKLTGLIEKIVKNIILFAGAQKGVLLLKDNENGKYSLEAEGYVDDNMVQVVFEKSEPTDEKLPLSIIRYVARTQTTVLLEDAANDESYQKTPYVAKYRLKSVLSVPIVHKATLLGVLYLENNLATKVFTQKHLTILNLLSSQMGIWIENALLYENMEHKVDERTAQLKVQTDKLQMINEKLLKLDEFKSAMTSMIVHDLKNPLNAIINARGENTENQLERVKQYGKQMLNLVMNILDVYKYEETRVSLIISHFPLRMVADAAIREVQFLADEKYIVINNQIKPEFEVSADKDLIVRMIVNLLTNAIKFSPINGEVNLLASLYRKVGTKNENNGTFVKIAITDNGPGIAKENVNLVFMKFGQIVSQNSGLVRSTGIGLTFCKMMAEAHGGEINVESGAGYGSYFWFTLPGLVSKDSKYKDLNVSLSHRQENPKLTKEDMQNLQSVLEKLRQTEVYKITELIGILSQIDTRESETVRIWKKALSNAIDSGNELIYKKLINHGQN